MSNFAEDERRLRLPTDPTSSRDPSPDRSRSRSTEDIATIIREFPRVVQLARNLLQKQGTIKTEKNTAATLYCLEQVRIFCGCYLNHMDKLCNCSYSDLCDMMTNLVALHYRFRYKHPEALRPFAVSLRRVSYIIQEIDNVIKTSIDIAELILLEEGGSIKHVKNFEQVADHLVTTSPVLDSRLKYCYHIPSVKDFQAIKLLGGGGFGCVYLARYKPADFVCAVKIMLINRLKKRNAIFDKTVASVTRSPHLAKVYASFCTKQAYVTVMEYNESTDVFEVIAANSGIKDPYLVQTIGIQVVLGIEHMHLNGLLHRDIKPANILVSLTGQVKLIDMDLSKVCIGHYLRRIMPIFFKSTDREYGDGDRSGTFRFTAPEVLAGNEYGRACDWWSMGISLFHMTFGYLPFRGADKNEAINDIQTKPVEIPRRNEPPTNVSYSDHFIDFISKLLIKDPAKRLGSDTYASIRLHPYMMPKLNDLFREHFNPAPIQKAIVASKRKTLPGWAETNVKARLENLVDLPNSNNHLPLYTYCDDSFRKLLDQIRNGASVHAIEEDEYSSDLNYDQPTFPAVTPISPTRRISTFAPLEITDTICIARPSCAVGSLWDAGFMCRCLTDDQGRLVLFVVAIVDGTPASKSDLLCGDMIVTWNERNITGSELPSRCDAETLLLKVLYCNAYRVLKKCRNFYSRLMTHFVEMSFLTLLPIDRHDVGSKVFGFKTTPYEVWDDSENVYKTINLVSFLKKEVRDTLGLLEGDIVRNMRPRRSHLSPQRLLQRLNIVQPDDAIIVVFIPFSILRSNNIRLQSLMKDVIISDRRKQLEDIFEPTYLGA